MSFPTIVCQYDSAVVVSDPLPTHSSVLQIDNTGLYVSGFSCIDQDSYLVGYEEFILGMSQTDFYDLWPLLVGLVIAGYIARAIRKMFLKY